MARRLRTRKSDICRKGTYRTFVRRVLGGVFATEPPPPVRLHPNLAEVYRQKIQSLRDALNQDDSRTDAAAILRSLIDEIRLVPIDGQLDIYLVGNLAAILDLCARKNPGARDTGVQITLVAGACNYRELTLSVQV